MVYQDEMVGFAKCKLVLVCIEFKGNPISAIIMVLALQSTSYRISRNVENTREIMNVVLRARNDMIGIQRISCVKDTISIQFLIPDVMPETSSILQLLQQILQLLDLLQQPLTLTPHRRSRYVVHQLSPPHPTFD